MSTAAICVLPFEATVTDAPRELDPLAGLVARVKEGDVAAFEMLYNRTKDQVHRTLYQLIGANSDMEDLIQQVYVQLMSAVKSFRGDSRFTTFLHRICANVALMHLRTKRRRPEELTDEVPEQAFTTQPDPERYAQVKQAAGLLQRALDQMSPKKRVVFVYHELMGMGPEEIAQVVDASPNTVRSRLHHARLEFTEIIKRIKGEPEEQVLRAGGERGRA